MTATAGLKDAAATAAGGTAVATRQPTTFPQMLEQWKPEIARALPKHLNADRMARIALTCFRNVPKLGECDPKSVFAAVIQAAQLGIEPGLMGEAHLVPYGKNVQLIPGYQGLIKLAKQTGQVVDIYAMVVREKDKFSCRFGLNRSLEHEPLTKGKGFPASVEERGNIIGVYAVAVFKDNTRTFVVMGADEVNKIRDASAGYQAAQRFNKPSPWTTHYEEMANKTAIRKLCKTLPKSPELQQALALEDAHYKGQPQKIDLTDALNNSYEPQSGDVIDVDSETGEVLSNKAGPKTPPPAANDGQQQTQPNGTAPDASAAPAAASTGGGAVVPPQAATGATDAVEPPKKPAAKKVRELPVSLKDVMAMVDKAAYDMARDTVRTAPYDDNDRAEVESAIKRHQAGGKV